MRLFCEEHQPIPPLPPLLPNTTDMVYKNKSLSGALQSENPNSSLFIQVVESTALINDLFVLHTANHKKTLLIVGLLFFFVLNVRFPNI